MIIFAIYIIYLSLTVTEINHVATLFEYLLFLLKISFKMLNIINHKKDSNVVKCLKLQYWVILKFW